MAAHVAPKALACVLLAVAATFVGVQGVVVSGSAAVIQNAQRVRMHIAPAAATGAVSAARVAQLCAAAIGLEVSPHVAFPEGGSAVRAVAPDASVGPAGVVCAVVPGADIKASVAAATASDSLSVARLGLAGPVVEPAYSNSLTASVTKLASVRGGRVVRATGAAPDVSCATAYHVAAVFRDAGVDGVAEASEAGDCYNLVVRHDVDTVFDLHNPASVALVRDMVRALEVSAAVSQAAAHRAGDERPMVAVMTTPSLQGATAAQRSVVQHVVTTAALKALGAFEASHIPAVAVIAAPRLAPAWMPDVAASRRLATGTNATQYTSAEIEEFQILLWTSLVLVAILAAVLCLMLNMDAHRDPVLYSQYKGTSRDVKRD